MIAARAGAVVNVASAAALQAVPTMAVHGATKSFVLSFTEALWEETRRTGVRVLALCPGPTDTAIYAATGKDFLAAGRQSVDEVVDAALEALDRSGPVVVPGLRNRVNSLGYRVLPRRVLLRVSRSVVQ